MNEEPLLDLAGRHVVIAGSKVVGSSAARLALAQSARVSVFDDNTGPTDRQREQQLRMAGATTVFGPFQPQSFPTDADVVVVSPGYPPNAPLLQHALALAVPVWGDVELAWRLSVALHAQGIPTPTWLALTGTNGKTTTVRMLECMLRAQGVRAVAAGNVGVPLLDVIGGSLQPDPSGAAPTVVAPAGPDQRWDVLALELSSFQLHYTHTMRPLASALLNIAPDHLDWHGGLEGYVADKQKVFQAAQVAIVNAEDQACVHVLEQAQINGTLPADAHCVSFTRQPPALGQIGITNQMITDCAFPHDGAAPTAPVPLAPVEMVQPFAPHNLSNALAAAALARAYGVSPAAVAQGLRDFIPEPHRIATVASVGPVVFVDDSKATNTHAAQASIAAFDTVVWIAGGLAKGATFDDLVVSALPHLGAVVLMGRDRHRIAQALASHAPHVPVHHIESADPHEAMVQAVHKANQLANSLLSAKGKVGHDCEQVTVLLAPACASMDMYTNYHHRGQFFVQAVQKVMNG